MENFVERDKELQRNRCIDLGNNKIWIRKQDPYGFWKINFDQGRMPEFLMGQYTTPEAANKDIETYLREKNRTPVK